MTIKEYLEVSETEALENAASCLRDRLLIRLPRRLGIRISEVLTLTVEDIDFNAGELTIEHLKARIKLACPKCGARLGKKHKYCPQCSEKVEEAVAEEKEHRRLRTLPVDKDTLALLKTYIEKGGPAKGNGKRLLFTITRQRAWQIFLECARKAGLPELRNPETGRVHHVSPHKLRDAFAVAAVKFDDSGDGLRLLQEQLGHQNITTTMKYRKVARTEHRDWFDKLSDEMK
jgi:integrase/recombinase XerD